MQKNGLLLIALADETVATLFAKAQGEGFSLAVDLPAQTLVGDGFEARFDIEPERKRLLIEGLDDIGLTLAHADAIRAFEAERRERRPWAFEA